MVTRLVKLMFCSIDWDFLCIDLLGRLLLVVVLGTSFCSLSGCLSLDISNIFSKVEKVQLIGWALGC